MSAPPVAQAVLEIARPSHVVAAHFFDVEGLVSLQPFHGIALELVEADARPSRMRRRMKVFDQEILDEVLIEMGDDGEWVERYVEGTNAGARMTARFTATGPDSTKVELQAFAPPGGFRFGLGNMSSIGVQRLLHKTLDEHRKALESAEARPAEAVGPALQVIGHLAPAVRALGERERKALVATCLEAACAVALADGHADDAEREVLAQVAQALCGVALGAEDRDRMVASAQRAWDKAGPEQRCLGLGGRLKALGQVELGLSVATLVAHVTRGIEPPEMAALERLAQGAGASAEDLKAVVERVAAQPPATPTTPPESAWI